MPAAPRRPTGQRPHPPATHPPTNQLTPLRHPLFCLRSDPGAELPARVRTLAAPPFTRVRAAPHLQTESRRAAICGRARSRAASAPRAGHVDERFALFVNQGGWSVGRRGVLGSHASASGAAHVCAGRGGRTSLSCASWMKVDTSNECKGCMSAWGELSTRITRPSAPAPAPAPAPAAAAVAALMVNCAAFAAAAPAAAASYAVAPSARAACAAAPAVVAIRRSLVPEVHESL